MISRDDAAVAASVLEASALEASALEDSNQFFTKCSAALSTSAGNEREGMHGCNVYLILCLLVSLKCASSVRLRIATGGFQA